MRESDWSRQNLLRSDWLPTNVAICTTFVGEPETHFYSEKFLSRTIDGY